MLGPALAPGGRPSHAYLFHGPGGAGKRTVARHVAARLLSDGSPDPDGARARVMSGAHPDLTWVVPGGAHEILVSDIDAPVVAAAVKTPFESTRRVFVIERVDELGDEAGNRLLKTLEEPAAFVHLILITDRLAEVMPTIRSRCQVVRFAPAAEEAIAERLGIEGSRALACARLALGDAGRAAELATERGGQLRATAERYARAPLHGEVAEQAPWVALLETVGARGEQVRLELDASKAAELELVPRRERRRVETEWNDRIRRAQRRAETGALDLGLQLVSLWYGDLGALAWDAPELVRHVDRMELLVGDQGPVAQHLRQAIELVEDTRVRFALNVSEGLACEALAYRLERVLAT